MFGMVFTGDSDILLVCIELLTASVIQREIGRKMKSNKTKRPSDKTHQQFTSFFLLSPLKQVNLIRSIYSRGVDCVCHISVHSPIHKDQSFCAPLIAADTKKKRKCNEMLTPIDSIVKRHEFFMITLFSYPSVF